MSWLSVEKKWSWKQGIALQLKYAPSNPRVQYWPKSNEVSKIMKSIKRKHIHPPNFQMENLTFHFKEY